jgi:hypothetical protein
MIGWEGALAIGMPVVSGKTDPGGPGMF